MTQKTKKEIFINSVRTVPIRGYRVTPTAVRYADKQVTIGHDALEYDASDGTVVDNFKVTLGSGDYSQLSKRNITLRGDIRRSAVGVAQDFTNDALNEVQKWAIQSGISMPKHIMVAEPLALEDATIPGESWLANYRSNIRRILHNFEEVDFMPEPFAVFQYYRYGVRYPLITEKRKHIALVLDFGGGTFDASVIETTAQGDISQSGRNQRPLAAKSVACAGYYINRCIAEFLLFKSNKDYRSNKAVRRGLELYTQGRWQDDDPTVNPEIHIFLRNFHNLVRRAEKAKIAICSSINHWDLSENLSQKVPVRVSVPSRIFTEGTEKVEISIDASDLRDIFVNEIWSKKLRTTINEVLRRADNELEGNQISIVLLSGGSSNIGWLAKLIQRDFSNALGHADILELAENFQEIVSKGLAVECARRYYTDGEGDFQAVLYNKLCLLLSPNSRGIELKKFRPLSPSDLVESGEDAVLLPAANSLRARFDQELTWKVRLSTTPNRHLDYHFLRSSFDPEDIEGQLNVVQKTVSTPKDAVFGKSIDVSLSVREDGTAVPKFVYGRGRHDREVSVEGTPFFLDMTSGIGSSDVNSYIGFDFGSSTSSFSLVSRNDVNVYRERAQSATWRELSDLVAILPYPIASHLARYLAETNAESSFKKGRAAIEAALGFIAYASYLNYCQHKGRQTSALFKAMPHRSAGPLWALLRSACEKTPSENRSNPIARLLDEPHRQVIDQAVTAIAKEKHDKAADVDFNRILRVICNVISEYMQHSIFGNFQEVSKNAFSDVYAGVFRSLNGSNEPFVELYNYKGSHSFSRNRIYIVDTSTSRAIDMTPLYLWGINSLQGDSYPNDLYMFDSSKGSADKTTYFYNAVQERDEIFVTKDGPLAELWPLVQRAREEDLPCAIFDGIDLHTR